MCECGEEIYHEKLPNIYEGVLKSAKNCCTTTTAKKFFPIITWLPKYELNFLIPDFVAGLTVGLTAIPQAIVYGTIAGLTPQYGLYSAFMGCFVYIFFGTCKDVTIGPTAIMSVMVQAHTHNADYAILACFFTGVITLLMGVLNLGVLVQFISIPVTTGFTMAAAITIASGQINNLFGISSSSNEFIESWTYFFKHINNTQRNDALLGIITLIMLLIMRKIKDINSSYKSLTKYISLSRNALAVVVGIILCYFLSSDDWLPFRVSGKIVSGLPPFKIPPFHTEINGTKIDFEDMMGDLGASLISIPLIAVLETIAVAKSFSMGKIIDASQEMVALGLANIFSSFFSSIPISGSFTRTAINNASGVKTVLGGAITGILVLMTLAFLTNTFYFIPKATLSAIIIAAMIFMVEYDRIAEIWRSKKTDMIPFLVTVLSCLFWTLEYGMVCGIVVNILFILYKSARPTIIITEEKLLKNIKIAIVDIQENLTYSSAEYLKSKVVKYISTHSEKIGKVVIRGEEIHTIDSTVALNILSLKQDLLALNCELLCWNWQIPSAGVICRLHPDARKMFKFSKTLQEVVSTNMQESTLTLETDCETITVPT
ncbi:sodium-independent sulfate anion transporter isoform X2 [Bactrocera dorsalis]|uniref:Sodium-independent sulfate anion transporter isoform X2 n=1 Tax=Bactrocera dorsalis TaxID=27457 RepID=A0A6I9V3X7_BACDO|nr:sodium-independent sulfate anion transporter isoform X2 [Bactrocera dorsalis]